MAEKAQQKKKNSPDLEGKRGLGSQELSQCRPCLLTVSWDVANLRRNGCAENEVMSTHRPQVSKEAAILKRGEERKPAEPRVFSHEHWQNRKQSVRCGALPLPVFRGQSGSGEKGTQPKNAQGTMLQLTCLTNSSATSYLFSMEHITLSSIKPRRNPHLPQRPCLMKEKSDILDPPRIKGVLCPSSPAHSGICSLTTGTKRVSRWQRSP